MSCRFRCQSVVLEVEKERSRSPCEQWLIFVFCFFVVVVFVCFVVVVLLCLFVVVLCVCVVVLGGRFAFLPRPSPCQSSCGIH